MTGESEEMDGASGKPPEADERAAAPSAEDFARAQRERDEFLDLARRARADYQNLHKRMEAQSAAVRKEAQQRVALDMIAILDDLERALEHIKQGQDARSVMRGVELVRENFLAALAGYGITPIEAMGAKFDHNLHHAIAEEPSDAAPAGTVVAVAQSGYMADGKLLRPAQVVVAAGGSDSAESAPGSPTDTPGDFAGE
jgi:molecular chaperone GrpE